MVEALVRRAQSPGVDPATEGLPRRLSYLDDDGASEMIHMAFDLNLRPAEPKHQVLLSGSTGNWSELPLGPRFE